VDLLLWPIIVGGVVVLATLALLYAPARTTILIDTPGSTARADMKLLWGVGPAWTVRALPKEGAGNPLKPFDDAARIGYALMTPGIAEVTYFTLQRLFALKPRQGQFALGLNLSDSAQNRVVQTAVQAVMAAAPAAVREGVAVSKCEGPGAEVTARFELSASPMQLSSIYGKFKSARATREFRKRLKRKPKASKKAPREVRAS
jgi:hypothetical protein